MSSTEPFAFSDATISFAVDVSGSTSGRTLEAEKRFVGDVAGILSESAKDAARVLPWNHHAQGVLSLLRLPSLVSTGMTAPAVLLKDTACRDSLRESSIWFLITDGIIDERERTDFANLIPKVGLHGTTCVTIIFGKPHSQGPSFANISVGVSVFAIVPNSLFLFYDVSSNEIYVLQSKGIFKSSLGIKTLAVINHTTTWDSLPRFSVASFSDITIPPPSKLAENEIALQDGLVVNLEDLWANRLSEEKVKGIFDRDDNLTSIRMTSQTRRDERQFQSWVNMQEIKVEDPLWMVRNDINGKAATAYRNVLGEMKAQGSTSVTFQQDLRQAFASNLQGFLEAINKKSQHARERATMIQRSSEQSATSSIDHASSMSSIVHSDKSSDDDEFGAVFTPSSESNHPSLQPYQDLKQSHMMNSFVPRWGKKRRQTQKITDKNILSLIHTPGFRNRGISFTGKCCLCGAEDTTLAWVFHASPELKTPGFPPLHSVTPLAFPLAMGNFAETDVLSSIICCDPCSYFAVKLGISPNEEHVTGALPMVSFSGNEQAYLGVLDKVLGRRFRMDNLPQVFISILLSVAGEAFTSRQSSLELFRKATEWTCKDLMHNSTTLIELSQHFSQNPTISNQVPLSLAIHESFTELGKIDSFLMRYPIEGFIILVRAAELNDIHESVRTSAVFRRFLYQLAETYVSLPESEKVTIVNGRPKELKKKLTRLLWSSDLSATITEHTGDTPANADLLVAHSQSVNEISISQLCNTPVLIDESHATFRKIREFQQLQDLSHEWVAPAIALFLHGMVLVQNVAGSTDAWDLLSRVMALSDLAVLNTHVQSITADTTQAVVKRLFA